MKTFFNILFCFCVISLLSSINTQLKHLLEEIKRKQTKTIMDVLQQEKTGTFAKIYAVNQDDHRDGELG